MSSEAVLLPAVLPISAIWRDKILRADEIYSRQVPEGAPGPWDGSQGSGASLRKGLYDRPKMTPSPMNAPRPKVGLSPPVRDLNTPHVGMVTALITLALVLLPALLASTGGPLPLSGRVTAAASLGHVGSVPTPSDHIAHFSGAANQPQPIPSAIQPATTDSSSCGPMDSVVATVPVGSKPDGAAYDTANGNIYVANWGSSNMSVIAGSTNTVVATVPLPPNAPNGAAYDSTNGNVYVTNWNSTSPTNVSVISGSTNTVVATVPVGDRQDGAAYDSSNGDVYVTLWATDSVGVISGSSSTLVATVPVGIVPAGAAYDSANGDVYVANTYSHNVSVMSGSSVVATIPVGGGTSPTGVAYDSANGNIYVTGLGSDSVSVISGSSNTIVATVPVGSGPNGAAFDSANGDVYVANTDSHNVSVISGSTNTVVATIPGGDEPWGVAYDSANGEVYVTNYLSNNVTVICGSSTLRPTYTVSFPESGLPSGTNWSVSLDGATVSSTAATIDFTEANGTYPFTIGGVAGYNADPSYGSLTVAGSAVTEPVTFSVVNLTTYTVTFVEAGLSSGTSWSVTLNKVTASSTMATIGFNEANGIYPFSVGSVLGYTASPPSGNLTVSGGSVTQAITFASVNATKYTVTFTESGLPTGTSWSVILAGISKTSTTPTIAFQEPNGTYAFSVGSVSGYIAAPSTGSFHVLGAPVSQSLAFSTSGGGSSPGFLGLSGNTGYYLLGGGVILAVGGVAVVLALRARRR